MVRTYVCVFVSVFLFAPGKKIIWFNSFWKQISLQIIKGKKLSLSYKIYPQSLYEIVKPDLRKGRRNPEVEKILSWFPSRWKSASLSYVRHSRLETQICRFTIFPRKEIISTRATSGLFPFDYPSSKRTPSF